MQATVKEKVLKAVQGFPKDVTFEQAMEELYFLYKVDKGLKQAEAGQKLSHKEAKVRMKKWLD